MASQAQATVSPKRSTMAAAFMAALIGAGLIPWRGARADDFRIQTKVYSSVGKEPVSENVTLFRGGLVCDFVENPAEVVVYNPSGATFVLLDPQRKVRTEVSLEQIEELTASLKKKLAQRDEYSIFLSSPTFRFQTDAEEGVVVCQAPWMHYHVRASPAGSDAVAMQYAQFSAQTTRLNALRRPALLARAAVNDWLNERKLIPQTVRLATFTKDAAGRMTPQAEFRSEHALTAGLSESDLARLAKVVQWQGECQRVTLAAYWGVAE